jgi:methylated-DNA-[protein]-cysteine S-methyltransferase
MSHHPHTHAMATAWDIVQTPLGPLTLLAGERGLTGLAFPGHAGALAERDRDGDALAEAVGQLEAYFAGERQAFDLPL